MVTIIPIDTAIYNTKEQQLVKYVIINLIKGTKPERLRDYLYIEFNHYPFRFRRMYSLILDGLVKITKKDIDQFINTKFDQLVSLVEPDPHYHHDTIAVEKVILESQSIHIHHMVVTKLAIALENIVMVCRYSYYVDLRKLFSDEVYDWLEAQAVLALPNYSPVHLPGSSNEASYRELTIHYAKLSQIDRSWLEATLERIRSTDFIFTGLFPKE